MMKPLVWYISAGLLLVILGCMGGRILYIDVQYGPGRLPRRIVDTGDTLKVLLFPLEYKGEGKILGRWVGLRGNEDIIRTRRPVGEAVTGAVFEYLKKAGFDVSMAPVGLVPEDLDAKDLKGPLPDLVLHGSVTSFSAEAVSRIGYTQVKTEFGLKLSMRNLKDLSIITANILSSSEPKTVVLFDRDVFSTTVSDSLSDAIENIFADIVLDQGVLKQAPEH